jgi:hypothetical protein
MMRIALIFLQQIKTLCLIRRIAHRHKCLRMIDWKIALDIV